MGTVFLFQIQDQRPDLELNQACEVATEILRDADEVFSLYKPDSEISRLVRSEIPWEKASPVQRSVREQVLGWQELTGGYFDPREGLNYDPSGLVKGWAAQNAAHYLEAHGIVDFTLNAGGDIYLSTALGRSALSRVGLSNLRPIASQEAGVNLILELAGTEFKAVATSGTSERGEHVWRSAGAARIQQVTVVARDLVSADVWATALLAGGESAWELFLERAQEHRALAIYEDGSMVSSPGFSQLLASL